MTNPNRRQSLRALGLMAVLGSQATRPFLPAAEATPALRDGLSAPGAILLIRHAQTVPGLGDPDHFRLGDCSTQRNLSEEGRAASRAWGDWLRQMGLVPTAVRSSQWCRCLDTARLMFPQQTVQEWVALNSFFQGHGNRDAQLLMARQAAKARARNVPGFEVWVTHQVVISSLTGQYTSMGEAIVARGVEDASANLQVLGRSSGPR
ncbi:MAG: histidine phosphatase family protein [Burkholderiaceae bacterium]